MSQPKHSKQKLTHKQKKEARRAAKAAKRAARDPHARLFPKPTRRQSIVMIVIVCVLAAISYYVRLAPGSTDDSLATTDAAQTAEKTDAASDSSSTTAGSGQTTIYNAGTYTAGKDIPAGQYKFLASGDEATIEVGSSTMVFTASYWLDLADGQTMTVTGATFVSGDAISPVNSETLASGGLYRVGVDCPAGVYVCTPTDGLTSASVVSYTADTADKVELKDTPVDAGTDVEFAPDTYVWLGGCDAVYGKE